MKSSLVVLTVVALSSSALQAITLVQSRCAAVPGSA